MTAANQPASMTFSHRRLSFVRPVALLLLVLMSFINDPMSAPVEQRLSTGAAGKSGAALLSPSE